MQLNNKPIALLLSVAIGVVAYSTPAFSCGSNIPEPIQDTSFERVQARQLQAQSAQPACYNAAAQPLTYSDSTQQAYAAVPATYNQQQQVYSPAQQQNFAPAQQQAYAPAQQQAYEPAPQPPYAVPANLQAYNPPQGLTPARMVDIAPPAYSQSAVMVDVAPQYYSQPPALINVAAPAFVQPVAMVAVAAPQYSYVSLVPQYYEIPQVVKQQNQADFQEKSLKYENSLKKLNIVLIIDHSGSQGDPDKHPIPGQKTPRKGILGDGWTKWDNTFMVTKYLAESFFEYDADGKVPVIFFDGKIDTIEVKNCNQLYTTFNKYDPRGGTNLLGALQTAFSNYATDPSQDTLFIVITDGEPNSGQQQPIHDLIYSNLTARDPQGLHWNVLFVRVGDDKTAIKFLKFLDNQKRTIGKNVDTKSDDLVYKMGPKALILNAIHEHLDKDYRSMHSIVQEHSDSDSEE